ncbi:hypothetical protein EXIGLDRAFT_734730 [Exidia glandulosa HHB12029]|uniref:Uncharacterized protein n=1 Tax=Exidia glandulosa HHB12029 TaxID=1314781 RepID=A0A165B0R0_EXIGL|nr:hypothetical protein EXIGLDRAFT_734730 [Exidia glandulosa HHB12029]
MADTLHPFVLNDVRSWQVPSRDVWGIGYFIYKDVPPQGNSTVYQNVYDAFAAVFPTSLPLATAKKCYWWKWQTSQDGPRKKAWTDILPLPPKV